MKKNVWLLSILFAVLGFAATAQISHPQGVQYFKPTNANPLDAIRQRHAQNAARLANTSILIDYATSNGDDLALANIMNMRFVQSDTFGDRYVVVAFDSLHDQPSNTGYEYSDFDSIRIDSVFFAIGHENNDGLSDTVIVKLVQLNAAGFPQNTTLWSQTFTSGATSFTGQTSWLQFAAVSVAPGLTIPSTTKFGFRVEYYGAKTDTFGYLASFKNLGPCANFGTNYSADLSDFWPNSYRFNVFNNLLLPNAAGQDLLWDCDGNGQPDRANPVQNINYIADITGIDATPVGPKVRLLRVKPSTEEVTIKNFGNVAQNITTYKLSSNLQNTAGNLSAETILAGSLNLNPGDTVKLRLTSLTLPDAGGDLALYANATNYADPVNLVDFMQWKTGGNGRQSVAVAKGIWAAGTFVGNDEPYSYIGDGYQDGVNFWEGYQVPLPTICDTLTNFNLAIDTPSLYPAVNGGYVSGHNSYGDLAKADVFTATPGAQVTGTFLVFGVAKFANANSSITVAVWNNNGANGAPGTVLTSVSVPINSLSTAAPVYVSFTNPALVPGSGTFYTGIKFTYAAGDTVALVTNSIGNGRPGTAWEEWGPGAGGGWHAYSDTTGWRYNIAHAILPTVCVPDTTGGCPTITINTTSGNAVCASINGTATANATGGQAPYTYAWSNTQTSNSISGLAAGTYTVTATDDNGCSATKTVVVAVTNTTLNLNLTDTDNTSCGTPNGSATVVATGGTPNYSYVWSGGNGLTATINALAAGTYTVTVFDANGCSGTGSTTLGNAPPTITVTASNTTANTQCVNPNGTATASATGGTGPYTYAWPASAGSQTTAQASNLSGGSYVVTATDAAGCTGTGNITVGTTTPTINVPVTASTPSTSCAAPDGSATVAANGGTGPYTYAWPASAGSQTTATATGLGGGTYTVTATDGAGCTGTGNVTITATTPVITVGITNATPNTQCVSFDGSGTVSASGGTGPYTYAWSGGQAAATATSLQQGTYTVTATDANSCTGTATVTINDNRPVLGVSIATSPVTSCVNNNGSATATVTGTGAPAFAWSTSPAQTGPTASNLAAGTYTVTVSDPASGCTVTGSETVGTNTPAVGVTISASNNRTNCDTPNGSATASGSGGAGGFTYAWSTTPAQTTQTATGLDAGSYSVTATSSNGCTASTTVTIATNTATVTVDVTTQPVTSCANPNGSAVAVASNGTAPYTYLWDGGQTTSTLNNVPAGAYSVTVTDVNGCEGSDNATIGTTTNPPTVTATVVTNESGLNQDDGAASASSTGGNAPYSYVWNTTPAQASPTATGLGEGTYSVTVTDAQGCTGTATVTILQVGIALPSGVSSLSLFPNPTTDVVNVRMEMTEAKQVKIEWFNMLGEKVINREFSKVNTLVETFSLSAMPEGIYMARITVGGESVTNRITVVR